MQATQIASSRGVQSLAGSSLSIDAQCGQSAIDAGRVTDTAGVSLLGHALSCVPSISGVPVVLDSPYEDGVARNLLRALASFRETCNHIPAVLSNTTSVLESMVASLVRRFGPKGYFDSSLVLSLRIQRSGVCITAAPDQAVYVPAIAELYEELEQKRTGDGLVVYALLYSCLTTVGFVYGYEAADRDVATYVENWEAEEPEDEDARGEYAQSDPRKLFAFDRFPPEIEAFHTLHGQKLIAAVEGFRVRLDAMVKEYDIPLLFALQRALRAADRVSANDCVPNWYRTRNRESEAFEDMDASMRPVTLFPFFKHSAIEQLFDDQAEMWMQTDPDPVARLLFVETTTTPALRKQLRSFRSWFHLLSHVSHLVMLLERREDLKKGD